MKRGIKKSLEQGEKPKNEIVVQPIAAWCWLASNDHELTENGSFSREKGELDWVRSQVASAIDVWEVKPIAPSVSNADSTRVSKQRGLSSPSILSHPMLRSLSPTEPPSMIFVASSNRNDPIDRAVAELKTRYPDAAIRLVLGEWWSGHRRTWPVAKDLVSAYWYQCHDLILPEILSANRIAMESSSIAGMALVVSDDSSMRQMWLDLLPGLGFQAFAAFDTDRLPEGKADVVIFDQADASRSSDLDSLVDTNNALAVHSEKVAVLRRTYPQAKIVVCFDFPRWNRVRSCIEAGADIIVGKPFRLEGLWSILNKSMPFPINL